MKCFKVNVSRKVVIHSLLECGETGICSVLRQDQFYFEDKKPLLYFNEENFVEYYQTNFSRVGKQIRLFPLAGGGEGVDGVCFTEGSDLRLPQLFCSKGLYRNESLKVIACRESGEKLSLGIHLLSKGTRFTNLI